MVSVLSQNYPTLAEPVVDDSTSSNDYFFEDDNSSMSNVEEREDSAVAAVDNERVASEEMVSSEPAPAKGSSDKKKDSSEKKAKRRGRSPPRRKGSKKKLLEEDASTAASSSKSSKKSTKSKSSKKKHSKSAKKSSSVRDDSDHDFSSNTFTEELDQVVEASSSNDNGDNAIPASESASVYAEELAPIIVESESTESSATGYEMPAGQSSTEDESRPKASKRSSSRKKKKGRKSQGSKSESSSEGAEVIATKSNNEEVENSDAIDNEPATDGTPDQKSSHSSSKKKKRSLSKKLSKKKLLVEKEPAKESAVISSTIEDGHESSESQTQSTDVELKVSEAEPSAVSQKKKKRSASPKKKNKDKHKYDKSVSSDAAVVSLESTPTIQSPKASKKSKAKRRTQSEERPISPGVMRTDDVWPIVKPKSKRKLLQEDADADQDPSNNDEEEPSTIIINGKEIKVNPAPKAPVVKTRAQVLMEEIDEQRKVLRQIGLSDQKNSKSNIFDSKGNIFDEGDDAPKSPGRGRKKQLPRLPARDGTPSSSRSEKPYLQLDMTSLGPAPDLEDSAPPRRGLTKTFSDLFQRSGSHGRLTELEKEPRRGRIRKTKSAKQLFGGGIEKLFRGSSNRDLSKESNLDRRGQMMKKTSSEMHVSTTDKNDRSKHMKRLSSDSDVLRKPVKATVKKKPQHRKAQVEDFRSNKMKKGQSEPNVKEVTERPNLIRKGHSESDVKRSNKGDRRNNLVQSESQRSSFWSFGSPKKRGIFRNKSDQNLLGKEERRGLFRGGSSGRLFKSKSDRAVTSPPLVQKDIVEVKLVKPLDCEDSGEFNSSELWAGTRLRKSKAKQFLNGNTDEVDSSPSSDSEDGQKNLKGSPTNRPNEEFRMRSLICDVWSKNKKDERLSRTDLPRAKKNTTQTHAMRHIMVLTMVALSLGKASSFSLPKSHLCGSHHHHRNSAGVLQNIDPHLPSKSLSSTARSMSLIPLNVEDVQDLISVGTAPTALQYTAYWGRTPRERYSRLVETFLVSILGMVFSYTLSFVLGGFVATILGAVFLFWGVFTPQLQAAQRNWEFLGGRELVDWYEEQKGLWFDQKGRGLLGALFLGRLADICVVEYAAAPPEEEYDLIDFQDYTMETDDLEQYTGNPYLLRVRLEDTEGRELQIHARLSEEYLDLEPGMEVVSLLLSKSTEFDQLAALTDLFVPATQTYIGDYPYLHRDGIENLLAMDDEIWQALQQESGFETVSGDFEEIDEEEEDGAYWESRNDLDETNDADGDGKKSTSWQPSAEYSNRDSSSRESRRKVSVGKRSRGRRRFDDEDLDDYD